MRFDASAPAGRQPALPGAAGSGGAGRWPSWVAVAGLACLLGGGTLALFSRGVAYDFVNYDDPRYITGNPVVQQGLTWAGVKWAFAHNADYWHPLTWISHLADWSLYGENAAGHHLTSVLWHAANAALAFLLLRRLTGRFWVSAFAAAVFAWHPLRVESVIWVTERKDVMSGFFLLTMLWAYVKYADRTDAGCRMRDAGPARARPLGWYVATWLLFVAGLMSKPSMVTAPLVLLALDAWPLRRFDCGSKRACAEGFGAPRPPAPAQASLLPRFRAARPLLLEKIPFVAASLATAFVTVVMQRDAGAFTLELPLLARILNVPVAIARYVGKLFWPTDLVVCYPHPGWWPVPTVIASTLGCLVITALAWRWRHTRPWFGFGVLWFLALLLPMAGLVQVGFQSLADRYTYVALIGPVLALSWLVAEWLAPRASATNPGAKSPGDPGSRGSPLSRGLAALASGLILLALGQRTWTQQAVWRDSETLFRHAATATAPNDVAEAFLAYTLASQGELEEATVRARRALELNPRNQMGHVTLARVAAVRGAQAEAAEHYRRVLELNPADHASRFARGMLLWSLGDLEAAKAELKTAAAAAPANLEENRALAEADLAAGRFPSASVRFAAAVYLEPADERLRLGAATARVEMGRWHEQRGERDEADRNFAEALTVAPQEGAVHGAWAELLARRGRFSDAVRAYRRAVELRPNDATSHAGLGFVLLLSGRRNEAAAAWREALRLDPRLPGLRERLRQIDAAR